MEHFAELHLHLDGSLRPETVWELAGKQGIRIPAGSVEETRFKMQVPENCRTLEEYLERFDLPLISSWWKSWQGRGLPTRRFVLPRSFL